MKLIGTSDIHARYGLDRGQVFRLIQSGEWPTPAAETGNGKLWHERDVEARLQKLQLTGRIEYDRDGNVTLKRKKK